MSKLPYKVIQIHSGFLSDLSELHDHAFASVHATHNTFYTDGLGKQEFGGKLGANPEQALFRGNVAHGGRLLVKTGNVFVAAIGDELAIDFLCAADGGSLSAAGGLRAMRASTKIDASLNLEDALMEGRIDEKNEENRSGDNDVPLHVDAARSGITSHERPRPKAICGQVPRQSERA